MPLIRAAEHIVIQNDNETMKFVDLNEKIEFTEKNFDFIKKTLNLLERH